MASFFSTYANQKVRGSIFFNEVHDAATVLAISNLLD
jgi:hypothetical protein